MDDREDLRREHDAGESDRDLRDDGDAGGPLRPSHGQLDNATPPGDRDYFIERLVRAVTTGRKHRFRAEPIRARTGPGLPVFPHEPAWFRVNPAYFTPERKSGNGTIPVADPGRDQTMNKPDRRNNPGP